MGRVSGPSCLPSGLHALYTVAKRAWLRAPPNPFLAGALKAVWGTYVSMKGYGPPDSSSALGSLVKRPTAVAVQRSCAAHPATAGCVQGQQKLTRLQGSAPQSIRCMTCFHKNPPHRLELGCDSMDLFVDS
eukprot:gene25848-biopygen10550